MQIRHKESREFRAVMERQSKMPFLRVAYAIFRGQCSNWDEEWLRESLFYGDHQCTLFIKDLGLGIDSGGAVVLPD